MTRAAVYARYSSNNQRDASIEDQARLCCQRIEREGWQLINPYTDRAVSGATVWRHGYQNILEVSRNGAFDVVVAEALDRLSRDQEDVAALYKQLSFSGVKLITLAEGEINELHVGLKGTMNALFLKDLALKTRRGLEGRVRDGRSGGGLCFGYDVVKNFDAAGERIRGERAINVAEAAVVRRIFADFAAGASPREIAKRLNSEGIPGPKGRPWGDTAIRGHHIRRTGILRNELYINRLVWNRQHYVKDPRTGKRLARPNPENEWVVKEVPELRIVDQNLWDRVQDRLGAIRRSPSVQKAQETRFWEHRRAKHLLTGLVHCGVCGGRYASVGKDYLACGAARRQGTCDNRRGMPRGTLEALILVALRDRLMAPELVETFIAEFHAEVNRLNRENEHVHVARRRELDEVSRKLDGLIDAIAEGLRSPGLQAKLEELEQRKQAIEASFGEERPPAPRLHPNLAELYRRKVEWLHQAIADPASRTEAIEILRGLVDSVTLTPIEKGFEIELVGEIVKMIALPDKSGGAKVGEFASSVKVVAGAGFEPATFRL